MSFFPYPEPEVRAAQEREMARMPVAKIYWGTPADVWHEVQVDWIKRPSPKPEVRS